MIMAMAQAPQRYDSYVRLADFLALKRELEEYKQTAADRQKMMDAFWLIAVILGFLLGYFWR